MCVYIYYPMKKKKKEAMESYKGGLKSYWKKYERLDGDYGRRRPRRTRIELGGGGRRTRKSWRIKIRHRLRFFARIRKLSLKRILSGIREAYVRTMFAISRSSAITGSGYFGSGPQVSGFGRPIQMKEYDEKMLVQMYMSILAQSQTGAAEGAAGCAGAARIAT